MRISFRAVLFGALIAYTSNAVRPSELSESLSSANPQHRVDSKMGPTQIETDKNSTMLHITVASKSSLVALATADQRNTSASGVVHNSGLKTGKGITDDALTTLFDEIDTDKGGKIEKKEWTEKVKVPGADEMWTAFDKNGDGDIDKDEWGGQWDAAVNAAFNKLGGADDGKIDDKELQAWPNAQDYEKEFAKKQFMADDGAIDAGEFEQFIYTDMLFCATSNAALKGSLAFSDISQSLKTKFGWADEAKFKADTDADGNGTMELDELYKYLDTKQKAFAASGGGSGGGKSGGMRSSLASAVFVATVLFAW